MLQVQGCIYTPCRALRVVACVGGCCSSHSSPTQSLFGPYLRRFIRSAVRCSPPLARRMLRGWRAAVQPACNERASPHGARPLLAAAATRGAYAVCGTGALIRRRGVDARDVGEGAELARSDPARRRRAAAGLGIRLEGRGERFELLWRRTRLRSLRPRLVATRCTVQLLQGARPVEGQVRQAWFQSRRSRRGSGRPSPRAGVKSSPRALGSGSFCKPRARKGSTGTEHLQHGRVQDALNGRHNPPHRVLRVDLHASDRLHNRDHSRRWPGIPARRSTPPVDDGIGCGESGPTWQRIPRDDIVTSTDSTAEPACDGVGRTFSPHLRWPSNVRLLKSRISTAKRTSWAADARMNRRVCVPPPGPARPGPAPPHHATPM